MRKYVPEYWFNLRTKVEIDFLWNILVSIRYDYVAQLVVHANKVRHKSQDLYTTEAAQEVCEDVAALLANITLQAK